VKEITFSAISLRLHVATPPHPPDQVGKIELIQRRSPTKNHSIPVISQKELEIVSDKSWLMCYNTKKYLNEIRT